MVAAYKNFPETQLYLLLRQGDAEAFTEIYNRHHKGVYGYLLGFIKDPAQAEDLVHEVFMKLWEHHPKLQINASFSAYLYRIAHNKAINAIKKIATESKLRTQVLSYLKTSGSENLFDEQEIKNYDRLLEDALNCLPAQRRKVFMLCRQEGRTYEETAAELGISRNTVKEHMTKAMKTMRDFLADKGEIALALISFGTFF